MIKKILFLLFFASQLHAQITLKRGEYFFDTDPGVGAGNSFGITDGTSNAEFTIEITKETIAGLDDGVHVVFVRFQDTNGNWGVTTRTSFYKYSYPVASPPPAPTNIVAAEYFFDADPGINGTGTKTIAIPTPPASLTDISFEADVSGLADGPHKLFVRFKNANNTWGIAAPTSFSVCNLTPPTAAAATGVTTTTSTSFTANWNPVSGAASYRLDVSSDNFATFFTGYNSRTVPGTTNSVNITGLALNTAYAYRVRVVGGCESVNSNVISAVFPSPILNPGSGVSNAGFTISWSTIGGASAYELDVSDNNFNTFITGYQAKHLTSSSENLTGLRAGTTYQVRVRAKNGAGMSAYSSVVEVRTLGTFSPQAQTINFDEIPTKTVGDVPFQLSATGGGSGNRVTFAATPSGIVSIGENNIVSVLTAGRVEIAANQLGIAGNYSDAPRVARTFCVNPAKPIFSTTAEFVTTTPGNTRTGLACNGTPFYLVGPAGFDRYDWKSTTETSISNLPDASSQVKTTASGSGSITYTLSVAKDGCTSAVSDGFLFNIRPLPTATISADNNGSLCGVSAINLTANPGSDYQYRWNNNATTNTISVTAPGNYYVTVTDGNGCQATSSIFSVTKATIPMPVLSASITSVCESSNTTLTAPPGYASYTWSNGTITQTTTTNTFTATAGRWAVTLSDGSCVSDRSEPIEIKQLTKPTNRPTVTLTGNDALCNLAFAGLSAPDGFDAYLWSNGSTSKSILVNTQGSYTVQVGQAPTCLSAASAPQEITTTGQPCTATSPPSAPTAANNFRCGNGNVSLTASGATLTQQYRWYATPTGGTALFTGLTFTPTVSATTSFYVSIFDQSTLLESARTKVEATVVSIAKPTIRFTGATTLCTGQNVLLSAPSGFLSYAWSDGSTQQQLLANRGGSYTVQVGDGKCVSAVSDAVSLTFVQPPAKPTIETLGSTTFCGSGSVELVGPNGFTYLWTNGETTQKITVTESAALSLTTINSAGCASAPSNPVAVTRLAPPCIPNSPPIINPIAISVKIEGTASVDLLKFISDAENNIDFSRLQLLSAKTAQGAVASIDPTSFVLTLDYKGIAFSGSDRITFEVYDLLNARAQRVIEIEVVGEVVVYNGVTPDGDGFNDAFYIQYIDVIQGGTENTVAIFSKAGDEVFKIENYNNTDRVFVGQTTNGKELPSGIYYYQIVFASGRKKTGYLSLKR